MKALNSFLTFLEDNKLYQMTPNHYTELEIMSFAQSKGFVFSQNTLRTKIEQVNTSGCSMSAMETRWTLEE